MATITRQEIIEALERLGQLAEARATKIELALVGGALMVLVYEARESTRDVDAVILAPREASLVRELAQAIAAERGWPEDWPERWSERFSDRDQSRPRCGFGSGY